LRGRGGRGLFSGVPLDPAMLDKKLMCQRGRGLTGITLPAHTDVPQSCLAYHDPQVLCIKDHRGWGGLRYTWCVLW
jgi:hypothetical protein